MAEPAALSCPACGGPLRPAASSARVICGHCGTVSEIASEGALRVAKVLERAGIRMPERPMTIDQIEDDLREREQAVEMRRKTAIVVAVAILVVVGGVVLLSLSLGR
jgi:uncharacterized Zn finger protein (UPF0148 family)